ncbi:MAG: hypothetical protein E6230_02720 [Paenibacillus dendritiformis]|uniref:hypothetical protein n=1 Tax=uncultured Paenibacillus sp. TaxID=227322 RepID=UPI0025DA4F37|nr:hypothetical protein [uncultured Paenibacillus sp.]MDU5141087.1 hypothetical protein [Paenibacillus dendritiformis]
MEKGRRLATKPVTPQVWRDIEITLRDFFHRIKLRCDGYEVTLQLQRISVFRNAIAVYINGEMNYSWLLEECEERKRFFSVSSRQYYSTKDIKDFKKIGGKRLEREMKARGKYTTYQPYWSSFRSLKTHFMKNNQNIELVIEEGVEEV